jgi:hypothetical protein
VSGVIGEHQVRLVSIGERHSGVLCLLGIAVHSIGENGHAKFEAAAGVHDDLVLAVALALWRLSGPRQP